MTKEQIALLATAGYVLLLSIITFIFYGVDKRKAKKNKFRISEKTLLLLALFGGAYGAFFGRLAFRHKTQKWYFSAVIYFSLLLYTGLICFLIYLAFFK